MIKTLDSRDPNFREQLSALLRLPDADQKLVRRDVEQIIADVRARGDDALIELTNRFDQQSVQTMNELIIDADQLQRAYESLDPLVAGALEESVSRVRQYHMQQLKAMGSGDWQYRDELGNNLGQKVQGMRRIGIYTPGGKAAYPSTVIMTAIPAAVAGVEEIVLCVPTPGGTLNAALLGAAYLCGISQVYAVGGAQAIAAMAYGTDTIAGVDKIVGPGNIYVATAKELVFGDVGIDMIAGPSEVVIVADEQANPEWVIQDMFAQAEHDEMAQAIVISTSTELLDQIAADLPEQLERQSRAGIIRASIEARAALLLVQDIDEAFDLVNEIAPEHLQLALANAGDMVKKVRHAGAIFVGNATAEVVGDYTAGPSHVLPTNGTARFASPLGVYDFQTRTSVIECSREGAVKLNRAAAILAREEGLDAHAESALARVKG